MRDLRIVFMGTPDFAVGVLKKLIEEKQNIVGVITAPDRQSGRGRKVSASAVKEYALNEGLKILQPTNLKDEIFLSELKALDANLQIVVAFRMLPKQVWQIPEYGTFNLHASLLPNYRGAAPINWAIINGEAKTGVTTFFIDEKIDTGAIIKNKAVSISEKETVGTLHDILMANGSELVLETVQLIQKDAAKPVAQEEIGILKEAPKLTNENTQIDWTWDPCAIDRFIRGLSPYPVAWTMLEMDGQSQKAKIYRANFQKEPHNDSLGKIITSKTELKVAVKNGYLCIEEIQLPGKRKMDTKSLLNGFSFSEGSKFT